MIYFVSWFEKGDVGNILDLEKCGFGVPPLNWTSLFAAAIKEDRSVIMPFLLSQILMYFQF